MCEIAELLISKGADVDNVNVHNRSSLMNCKGIDMLRLLLKAGANIDHRTNKGDSLLMFIAMDGVGHIEALQSVINAGATIDTLNKNGYSALMYAVKGTRVCPAMVESLLTAGADVSLVNNRGRTAYDMCQDDKTRLLIRTAEFRQYTERYSKFFAANTILSKDVWNIIFKSKFFIEHYNDNIGMQALGKLMEVEGSGVPLRLIVADILALGGIATPDAMEGFNDTICKTKEVLRFMRTLVHARTDDTDEDVCKYFIEKSKRLKIVNFK